MNPATSPLKKDRARGGESFAASEPDVMVSLLTSEVRGLLETVEAQARADERARILPRRLFLSETELVELTGYHRRKNQIQWLRERHWPFELASGGRPRVLRDAVIVRLGGSATTSTTELKRPQLRLPP
jgi:hypothetical protein